MDNESISSATPVIVDEASKNVNAQSEALISTLKEQPEESEKDDSKQVCLNHSTDDETEIIQIKLSRQRWAILLALFVFGLNSSVTDTMDAILQTILDLLELDIKTFVYYQQLFLFLPALSAVPTAWFVDRYGIRKSMYCATIFMIARNVSRAILFSYAGVKGSKHIKMIYWGIMTFTTTQVGTIFYCLPLKIAESWFPASERSLAWTLLISTTSIGSCFMNYFLPRLVREVQDLKHLIGLNTGFAIVTTFFIVICITKSKPKHPPSERVIRTLPKKMPLSESLKRILKNKPLMLLIFLETVIEGFYYAYNTLIQDILTASGHSKEFVGDLLTISGITVIVALLITSVTVHKFTNIDLACKAGSLIRTITLNLFIYSLIYPMDDWIVITITVIFSICKSLIAPHIYNMVAHLTAGQIPHAVLTGLMLSTTIYGICLSRNLIVLLMKQTPSGVSDYLAPNVLTTVCTLLATITFTWLFKSEDPKQEHRTQTYSNPSIESA